MICELSEFEPFLLIIDKMFNFSEDYEDIVIIFSILP